MTKVGSKVIRTALNLVLLPPSISYPLRGGEEEDYEQEENQEEEEEEEGDMEEESLKVGFS